MVKITAQLKLELRKSLARCNPTQSTELFISMLNKQAREMIKEFEKGTPIEEMKDKWISD